MAAKKSRAKEATFASVLAETSAASLGHPKDGRATARVSNDGVWDEVGLYWPEADDWLTESEADSLVRAGEVKVGIQAGFGSGPRFFKGEHALRLWLDDVRPQFAEEVGIPRRLDNVTYVAELRKRPDGSRLLWFEGMC